MLPVVTIESLVGHKWFDISNNGAFPTRLYPQALKPILEDVCMPPFAIHSGYMDLPFMIALAIRLQPSLIAEFGTAHGNSIANLLNAVPTASAVTVNALSKDTRGDQIKYKLDKRSIGRVYRRRGLSRRVIQLYCNTDDVIWPEGMPKVDMAIIDACHDRDFVYRDFITMSRVIGPKGIILLHDTLQFDGKPFSEGSYDACSCLRSSVNFDIRWVSGTWWGIYTPDWDALLGANQRV